MSSKSGEGEAGRPRRQRPARSIAAQLAILFTASSALLLGGVIGAGYSAVAAHLDQEHTFMLNEIVSILRDSPPRRPPATPPPDAMPASDGRRSPSLPRKWGYRTVSASGETAVESLGIARVPRAAFAGAGVAEAGAPALATPWQSPDGAHFLLAAASIPGDGGQDEAATLQVALEITDDDELLVELRWMAVLALIAGVAASSVAGALVARLGLRPIGQMAAEMAHLSANRLSVRLSAHTFPAELHRLVDAFNGMVDRLDHAFADISAYSANLAHELRTPLGNLRGGAEVALSRSRTTDEYREVLASSLEELERLSRMVDALLFLARADRREAALARKPVAIAAAARAVVDLYTPLAEEKGVTLAVSGDAVAALDADLFRRALGNLVANALAHTPRGGHVTVTSARNHDGSVEVRVTDDGSGIAAADLPRVFERFYRGADARDSAPVGSGLGLSIVRSIIELHGGRVGISSTPGAGAEVTIRLPAG